MFFFSHLAFQLIVPCNCKMYLFTLVLHPARETYPIIEQVEWAINISAHKSRAEYLRRISFAFLSIYTVNLATIDRIKGTKPQHNSSNNGQPISNDRTLTCLDSGSAP